MKRKIQTILLFSAALLACANAYAAVTIETSVSHSRVPIGESVTLDIIVANADGKIETPKIPSVEGFSVYAHAHSQEFTFTNGRSTSQSVFSYTLIANSLGEKVVGPFLIVIGGKEYKVAPVKLEVVPDVYSQGVGSSPGALQSGQVQSPPQRALPAQSAASGDIFVKAWLDKDEVYVNEPAILTYTLYTRLSATYKGFEKEPVTTGFWVEDFPPEKNIQKTEQILNGSRYVVADVRKLALFPTQAGVFTVDPGILSASVELRDDMEFGRFNSRNIFGSRTFGLMTPFSQVVSKTLMPNPITLAVKTLPEAGKPKNFNGAVGQYSIESSIDKTSVEAGDPVTFRVRIWGQGNINTLETPALAKLDDFKVYDSSSSSNLKKERLVVTGEKVTETVIVGKRAGTYTIPSLEFSYFDPVAGIYKELKTQPHTLQVNAAPHEEAAPVDSSVQAVAKEDVALLTKDIRYIKLKEGSRPLSKTPLVQNKLYWALNGVLLLLTVGVYFLRMVRQSAQVDSRSFRMRRSLGQARKHLRSAEAFLKPGRNQEYYAELSKALNQYFADKLNISPQQVSEQEIELRSGDQLPPELYNQIRELLAELARGRFALAEADKERLKEMHHTAEKIITRFEKVKLP